MAKISDIKFIQSRTENSLLLFDEKLKQKFLDLLFSKRHDRKQQEECEYEIIVGALLKEAGFDIIHEQEVNSKTPDWYINGSDNYPDFILEVGVLNSEQIVAELEEQISELKTRVNLLQFNAEIMMDLSHFIDPQYVTDFINMKGIIQDLNDWLSDNPSGFMTSNEVIFQYIKETDSGIILQSDSGYGRVWRDDRFVNKLEEKRDAYCSLTVKKKLPYIIAIISTFHSGTTLDRIIDILTGSNQTSVQMRVNGSNLTSVCGILVIEPLSTWQAQYFDNSQTSIFKLPKNIMEKVVEKIHQ